MNANPSPTRQQPGRSRRSPGELPPPPKGVAVITRVAAAEFMGVAPGTFGIWERDGRVTIPRYRAVRGAARAIVYATRDLAHLREELQRLEEPSPDPERPGVYRVPIRSRLHAMAALIDAADLPKVRGRRWNVRVDTQDGQPEVILSSMTERTVPLKRIIMGLDAPECKEQLVSFVNGDPLDCRRANLVLKSRSEVNLHRAKSAGRAGCAAASVYRGVGWDTTRRLWKVQIGTRETHQSVGRFRDEAQAAAAYDDAARAMFGDAAPLNFPDGIVPAPTFLGPDGEPVREKNRYRVPRDLPPPAPGVAMLTRDQAAAVLEVSSHTFGGWELNGEVSIPRYREKAHTGAPILYAAADIARLRAELDKVGQPYADPHPARAGVWRVPLRTLGGFIEALIDEADLAIVQGKKWNYVKHAGSGLDRATVIQTGPRDTPSRQLKRLIMGLEGEGHTIRITHANGNPLDCRRENLITSGPKQSTRRGYKILQRSGRPTSSRFKGVSWNEREGAWVAQIRTADVHTRLGCFDDEEDAADAYDEAARGLWGAQARVNFPEPGELPSAAAPVAPAELWPEARGPAARPPGKPESFAAVLNPDGSVTLSWRSARAAASAGVTFAVSRRLPGQSEFVRIGTAGGTTSQTRRPTFTDATVPAADLSPQGQGAEYLVQGSRGTALGEPGDVLVVRSGSEGTLLVPAALAQAA